MGLAVRGAGGKRVLTHFRGGRLFDGQGDEAVEGMEVLVEDDRIVEVSDRPIHVRDVRLIELGGRTLMPGLIDAHVHAIAADANIGRLEAMPRTLIAQHARLYLEAMLERGFTTVRDAGGADWGLARAVELGLIAGPRIFFSGRALSQTGGHGDMRPLEAALCSCGAGAGGALSVIADGVDAVRRAAREELRRGASQIKIMASGGVASPTDPIWNLQYSEEEIRAAVWEAQSWRAYVMAHAYTPEAIGRCIAFGVRSIEHANLIDRATADRAAAAGAFVVPTLVTYDALDRHGRDMGLPEISITKLAEVRHAGLRALEHLSAAGAKIGFGTDLLAEMQQWQSREFVIRREVLPPAAILRQATSGNAELLQRPGQLGCVRPGALADLIVVDGDPTRDLSLLDGQGERIPVIMKGGRLHRCRL